MTWSSFLFQSFFAVLGLYLVSQMKKNDKVKDDKSNEDYVI